ncbi:MAG: YqjK-like family protein [Azonexus sp.]
MNPKLLELATRHGRLQARIAEQRRELARHAAPLESALAKGDAVLEGVDWLKHHPLAVGAAVAALAVARPQRAWRWARRGFFVWRGWQAVRKRLAGVR